MEVTYRNMRNASEVELRQRNYRPFGLIHWRELPSPLGGEPELSRFRMRVRRPPWMVFMKGYSRGLPDWLAVNIHTGEIRKLFKMGLYDGYSRNSPTETRAETLTLPWSTRGRFGNPPQLLLTLNPRPLRQRVIALEVIMSKADILSVCLLFLTGSIGTLMVRKRWNFVI